MAGDNETESSHEEAEGGPVKSFLEHLEDFRWVLIKSIVTLGLAMLICLFAANHVVQILKWPLTHNPVRYFAARMDWHLPYSALSNHNGQQVTVIFETNHLGSFSIGIPTNKSY